MAKRRRISLWSRDEILCCRCADLPTVHIHCPCDSCYGKAVNRSTEYRHWASTRDYLHGVVVQSNNDSSDEGLVHVEQDKAGEVEEGTLQVVETQSQDGCACVSQSLSIIILVGNVGKGLCKISPSTEGLELEVHSHQQDG